MSENSSPDVYEGVLLSVSSSCLSLGLCGQGVSVSESSFELEQFHEQEASVSENMTANESLHEPCRASGVENESERRTMCIFSCVRASLNEIQKQKESGVLGRGISIETAIASMSKICLVLSVSAVLVSESSCVLGLSCETGNENGLNSSSSLNSWKHCYSGWQL